MGRVLFQPVFLVKANRTGNNQIKSLDSSTNTSAHHTWEDWKDMKEVADQFLHVLTEVVRTRRIGTASLRTVLNVNTDGSMTTRLTKFNNDQISGVGITFTCVLSYRYL
jgi:hypothetical protein